MYTVLSTLFCIAGWITALIVNVVWYKHCDKMNNEWYERCLSINETWADLCMELIGDETDRKTEPSISKMEQVDKDINVRSKEEPQTCSVSGRPYSECADCEHFRCTADEPQTETSTNNSTISEKLQLKCDLCRREGDDICIDCERKKRSGKE